MQGVALVAIATTAPAFAVPVTTGAAPKGPSILGTGGNGATAPAPTSRVSPLYGTIDPFYGTIDPFYGTIDPFYGTINPFYGNIDAFYGTIDPFYGNIDAFWGTLNPYYGTIDPFYGTIDPFYGTIGAFDAEAFAQIGHYWDDFGQYWLGQDALWADPLRAAELGARFDGMVAEAETVWGSRIQAQTGSSFDAAFLAPLMAKYGITSVAPTTLQAMSANRRAQFFLDWYDGLMGYSGADRIDHWMRTVNWRPAITQQQGSGADSIIGLIDGTASGDPDLADNIAWSSGYGGFVSGHGVGVASLMVAAHDGRGVMGIAPNATVIAFNPFDQTNTASWDAVREGVIALAERNASVINMSLGVPGYTLHADISQVFFDPQVTAATRDRVFVLAAGNSGAVQPGNVAWDFSRDPHMIIVGSVNAAGDISGFSNRPGDACLTEGGVCGDLLMNRFMVAPGELILMPDGQGGFVRRSGTSFSAPLVSGAITLLHDRWPWLAQHPGETVDIMLRSARDLGAPGVDAVYGHGLLDVEASQSPLNFDSLQFYEVRNGQMVGRSAAAMRQAGIDTTWQSDGVYFQLYETVGDTFRDFSVPVSSLLVGKVGTLTGGEEYLQEFATGRMTDWIRNGNANFSDVAQVTAIATPGLQVTSSASRPYGSLMVTGGEGAIHSLVRIAKPGTGLAFTAGIGNGAMAIAGQHGLGLHSDYGRQGGVNPLLSLASGGAFMAAEVPLGTATSVSFGLTQQHLDHRRAMFQSDAERAAFAGVEAREADAMNVRMTHRASPNLTFSGAWARISERNSLLGVQSRELSDLSHGAVTDTLTIASTLQVRDGFTLAVSGTAGRTTTAGSPEQGFTTDNGVLSSAFAVSATWQGVLGRGDALRLSVAQPFHVERGELNYSSVEVVDRATGELGVADQSFDIGGAPRAFTGEVLYATPILDDAGEVGLFGRADLSSQGNGEINQFAVGGRVNVRF
ncbi:MAG: S8 family peptidase [Allosphingosinicella sp.]